MDPVTHSFPVAELDYELPPELIAQAPAPERSGSRMLVLNRADGALRDLRFTDLPRLLAPGDVLVVNNTRVLPARFDLFRKTGGRIEALFLAEREPGVWEVMLKNAGRVKPGEPLELGSSEDSTNSPLPAGSRIPSPMAGSRIPSRTESTGPRLRSQFSILNSLGQGRYLLAVQPPIAAAELLARMGRPPLPPYIRRAHSPLSEGGPRGEHLLEALDVERYQTVYARAPGAVAAPTAGLHFTEDMFAALAGAGIDRVELTLHVGPGTFAPVTADDLRDHEMHAEWYEFPAAAAERINRARASSGRVVAVGTTSVRVLESCADDAGQVHAGSGWTRKFCYPPYHFRAVDALVTNFHLPRSTLLALVMAFAEVEPVRRAYRHAIEQRYRFYSYGDAMLIV